MRIALRTVAATLLASLVLIGSAAAMIRPPSYSNDVIFGTAASESFRGLRGNDVLNGLGGGDTIRGDSGDDYIDGDYKEVDSEFGVWGNDKLYGGRGDDWIEGNDGDDRIYGGPGRDELDGNDGDDFIDARDARRDHIDCGPGTDAVRADKLDRVNTASCESIRRS